MSRESRISNISDYVDFVCRLNAETKNIGFLHEYELLFRGQPNKNYDLIPSIGRNRKSATKFTIFNDERNLIEMAKYKMPDIFRDDLKPVELLALLQHHGIPTRLLDVTENALVALFFACSSNENDDGEVVIFENDNLSVVNYPVINAIADSYRFANCTWTDLSFFYEDTKRQPYFIEQDPRMDSFPQDNYQGGQWIKECCQEILYIYAPVRSLRQQIQHGRYILFPNKIVEHGNNDAFEKIITPIPKDHQDILKRIIIPKEIKQQLILDLSIMGITEDFLFCDNIDVACKGIVDLFKKRY